MTSGDPQNLGPERWWVDVDLVGSTLLTYAQPFRHTNALGQLRAVVGLQLTSRIAIFAGATANGLLTSPVNAPVRSSYLPVIRELGNESALLRLWPGALVGVRY